VIEDIPSKDSVAASSEDTDAPKGPSRDTIEAKPGLIETTELAPLGEEKVVADREYSCVFQRSLLIVAGLISQATTLGKKAYEAVMGSSETK
jgi:hypothetical protein